MTGPSRLTVPEPWSHNTHYHRVIVGAVPDRSQRALDVGCGLGALTRRLRRVVPHVTGIDRDERCIELARAHPGAADIAYLRADFLQADLEPGSLDVVASIAALHHMDAETGLRRMAELLRPGGVLAVVGLARDSSPAGLGLSGLAVLGDQVHRVAGGAAGRRRGAAGPAETYVPPVVWPPSQTYREVRRLAARLLPGVRYRRRLYWRYSLVWRKPRLRRPTRSWFGSTSQVEPNADVLLRGGTRPVESRGGQTVSRCCRPGAAGPARRTRCLPGPPAPPTAATPVRHRPGAPRPG
jgi:SAM-dependent methyltransferase